MNSIITSSELYFKKAIKLARYLMFFYLLIMLSSFANSGLSFGTIINLFFVVLFFQVQYNLRWYSLISVVALGLFVFFKFSSFGILILNFINDISYYGFSNIDFRFLFLLSFRLFILAFSGLCFYYAMKGLQLKNGKKKSYGTLDEDEIGE